MPDFKAGRNTEVELQVRDGGQFIVGLNGPVGEATHVNIGIVDPIDGVVLRRAFEPDLAEDIANNLLEVVKQIRDGT